MRINVLQHTPDEGPGTIKEWADNHDYELYVYHPYMFGMLPTAAETDFLVILGGPMSPNNGIPWIEQERELIQQLVKDHKPIFGACFGAQQITKVFGKQVVKSPAKEVGWASVYLQSDQIPGLPHQLTALHWHEDCCELPDQAELLFSSDLVQQQGFLIGDNIIGLQFHLEPTQDNVHEMIVNDGRYALDHNDLQQTPTEIDTTPVPSENKTAMFQLLDFLTH
ncbi:type 1 glutamine amidotransferase [Fructilactobacillus cliffordii]|uniref:Type 1 glutamine amidotransferase n=1 Tax=Fructilactobacillus cliffordii TaxID=2940299 RepID=A0A9Q8ZYM3_9LACO|nr:type 1 glutamine amidotransferase [Fructilactobacillus cliffordii]USS89956.1 type 1 glutamine amidotransferase [Fructilactobacillus cliffordii]